MKYYLLEDGSLFVCPDGVVNFEEGHPVFSAKEIAKTEYLELVESRKPKPQPETWREARKREYAKIEDEYSASRSFKRGATAQARNMDIPQDVIQANNRWRQKERSRGSTPHMSLLERYTDAKASAPLLVKFSGGL